MAPPGETQQSIRIKPEELAPGDSSRFFFVFPIEGSEQVAQRIQRDGAPISDDDYGKWCIQLNLRQLTKVDRKDLVRRLGVKDRFKDYLVLPWETTAAKDKPVPAQRTSSFVIDYDDPRFSPVWSKVVGVAGRTPDAAQLVQFAGSYINVKTTTRMFDTASEVAQTRQGDCTEHATLLTALLRRSGRYARLVTGLVILVEGQQLGAFGHAWTELYDEPSGEWRIMDAALHPVPGQSNVNIRATRYLPVARMVDESPGFSAAMSSVLNIEAISSVRVAECPMKKPR